VDRRVAIMFIAIGKREELGVVSEEAPDVLG
jgi:hypothetical protein